MQFTHYLWQKIARVFFHTLIISTALGSVSSWANSSTNSQLPIDRILQQKNLEDQKKETF